MVAPALEHLYDSLAASEETWLLELAHWYEARLRDPDQRLNPVSPEPVIRLIEPSRRDRAKAILRTIEVVYSESPTRASDGQARENDFDLSAATAIFSPPPKSDPASHEDDFSIHDLSQPASGDTARPPRGDAPTVVIDAQPAGRQAAVNQDATIDLDAAFDLDATIDRPAGQTSASDGDRDATGVFTSGEADGTSPSGDLATIDGWSKPPAAPAKAIRLPGYVIQRELGRGGMGVVYLARQKGVERPVALKVVLSGAHASRQTLARFEAEARVVGRFQHENIVRIYEVGQHEGLPYFSLEYVDGATLADRLQDSPLPFDEAARLTESIARALDYAHKQGVIHRDLKPGNVLLTREGVPKVADFGLAKTLEGAEEFSQSGSIVGTPGYMAPEQARGDRGVGPAADIYGLGAMLYCMLTVRPPFQGATASETLLQVLQREPVQPSQLRPDVPKDLETICVKCLQKTADARYASAAELADDLARFRRGEPITARPIPRVERVWRWCRRNPTIAVPTAVAATLAAALTVGGPIAAGVIYSQKQSVVAANAVAAKNEQAARDAEVIAKKNAQDAQAAEQLATAKAEEARLAQLTADANAREAQQQQKLAVDALKSMTFEVQRTLQGRPELQPLRHQLIQVVRDGLQRMEQQGTGSGQENIIAAGIYRRLGDLAAEVDQLATAWQHYEQCLAILRGMDAQGVLPNRHHNLSEIHHLLAQTASRMHRFDLAREHAARALDIRREWLAESDAGKKSFVRENVAATLGTLAFLNFSQGHLETAKPLFDEAAELRKAAYDESPGDTRRQQEWFGAQWSLARLDMQYGHLEAALTELDRLIAYFDDQLAGNSQDSVAYLNRVLLQLDRGQTLLYLGRTDKARETYKSAVDAAERIAEEAPAELRVQTLLANALYGLAVSQRQAGDDDAADASLERCRDIRANQLDADPEVLAKKIDLLYAVARLGNLDPSSSLLESVENSEFNDSYVHYQLAAIHALASRSSSGDAAADDSDDAKQHRSAAMQHLTTAIEHGYRRYADLEYDPDLASIRGMPGFPQLSRTPSGEYSLAEARP